MSTLSEELSWRGFVDQSTFSDIGQLDAKKYRFYWGVDPSASSMTVGHLAMGMMIKHFIRFGYEPYLLVGGATGMIGDPDGKSEERTILSKEVLERNKQAIADQYKRLFAGSEFKIVDNFDWFKDYRYLDFLRDIGKHVPLSQMLGREFIQARLKTENSGISYAEFSYVLIQAYDFLFLNREHGVELQVSGSDQWGNSVAGVDLIRRLSGKSAHVWTGPLVVNPQTGVKFGKTESGAVWLDPKLTSPSAFYQFWVNTEDSAVEHYLKIFTMLTQVEIAQVMKEHSDNQKLRIAQKKLADEVTKLIHGEEAATSARRVTDFLIGDAQIASATDDDLSILRSEIPKIISTSKGSIISALVSSGLAASNTAARQLIGDGAVYINNKRVEGDEFKPEDFTQGRLLIRRGKAFRDSALVELSD
ncbi:MAG: tyrosine--tRNA ligase [Candidatus Saccharimonadales bacterium]